MLELKVNKAAWLFELLEEEFEQSLKLQKGSSLSRKVVREILHNSIIEIIKNAFEQKEVV